MVVEYSDENKMNSSNIAKVFAPNLLRAEHMDTAMFLEETPQAARLLEALIDNYDFFLMVRSCAAADATLTLLPIGPCWRCSV